MSDPLRGKRILSRLKSVVKKPFSKLRGSPSPQVPAQSAPSTLQTTAPASSHSQQIPPSIQPGTSPSNASDTNAATAALAAEQPSSTTESPLVTAPAVGSTHSEHTGARDDPYTAISESRTSVVVPETGLQRTKAVGSVVYEGLKTAVQGLYDCSDMLPPLKAAAGGLLTFIKIIDTVLENKKELEELKATLTAIILIIKKYREFNSLRTLDHRIENFCQAIAFQLKAVEHLQDHSWLVRAATGSKDADTILKTFRNIRSLCNVFQIDTELNIEGKVEDIHQRLTSSSVDKLYHEMTSYKTRHSSYGNPVGCMEGTRIKILEDLETWASDPDSRKVYWMVGMFGTGKSTISHSLCKILEDKNMLGSSFFASRASEKTNNARLIIPVIAHVLARASPFIKYEVVKAIEEDPALAEPTYNNLDKQFKKLIYDPVRTLACKEARTYKIVVIDAVDECSDLIFVSSLIKLLLESVSNIPLKIFIASRDETLIRNAFNLKPELQDTFYLHEVEKDVVKDDIKKYVTKSLAGIQKDRDNTSDAWPPQAELSALLDLCGTLFIYAATATRFIDSDGYRARLSFMVSLHPGSRDNLPTAKIDDLYGRILEEACKEKLHLEVGQMRETLAATIFLQNPLSIKGIESLLAMPANISASQTLSGLKSLVHVPTNEKAPVTPFHASFPDFITDSSCCSPERCPSFPVLVPSEHHEILALKCLELMNCSLKHNICDIPEYLTVSRQEATNPPHYIDNISEALKYSSVYWASHLAEIQVPATKLIDNLWDFLHKHLLHWIECLSMLGELLTGLKSLRSVMMVLSHFKTADIRCHNLQLLADDAYRCLQLNFECIQRHCFQIYQSALVWIPKESLIRDIYATDVRHVPKLILGLSNQWGPAEIVVRNGSPVDSVAFSQDGTRVVSGSRDGTVQIWNTMTGEVQAELKGHTDGVSSVAFSQDGTRVISGSEDMTVRIWNTMTGEVQEELKGHRGGVLSVAFSQDGTRVVSGSEDKTVRIWNTMTGEVQAELKGHTGRVLSVAFSQDGTRVVSGSEDMTVQIWNTTTGEVQAELKGHTGWVSSVAFSQDGTQVVSGSEDKTVRIWNMTTGKVQAELKGHTGWVLSVAFSQDGTQVVSGSEDKTVRIWNTTTGEVQAGLEGHTGWVLSVAFSQDGTRVVSGSDDNTVRIWNTTTGEAHTMSARTIKLPDSTDVHWHGYGQFDISYPTQSMLSICPPLSLSQDHHWVVGALHDCWIPPHDRAFISSSFSPGKACFGYESGRVVILDMAVDC